VALQAAHATPPVPQVAAADVWHLPLASQQPLGHVFASHTHLPCELHSWFVPHAAHTPPLAPQSWFDAGLTHWPLAQHPLQLAPPHEHAPALHASPVPHSPQSFPLEPHAAFDWAASATQVPSPAQQPLGHEVAVQTHVPLALQA
jgi:hypothetical protein